MTESREPAEANDPLEQNLMLARRVGRRRPTGDAGQDAAARPGAAAMAASRRRRGLPAPLPTGTARTVVEILSGSGGD